MKLSRKSILKQNSLIDRHRREYGDHIDAVDEGGNTFLMVVLELNVLKILKLSVSQVIELINAGADVNKTNNAGETALMLAVRTLDRENACKLIACLISAGATNTINSVTNNGLTALSLAYGLRNVEACCMLLGAGASASMPTRNGDALFKVVGGKLNFYKQQNKQDLHEIRRHEVIYSAMQSSVEAELIVATVLSTGPLQNVIVHDSTAKAKKARRI